MSAVALSTLLLPAHERPSALMDEIYNSISDYEHCVKKQAWAKLPGVISRLQGVAQLSKTTIRLQTQLEGLRAQELHARLDAAKAKRRILQASFERASAKERKELLASLHESTTNAALRAQAEAVLKGETPSGSQHLVRNLGKVLHQQIDMLVTAHLRARVIASEANFALHMVGAHHSTLRANTHTAPLLAPDAAAIDSLIKRMQHECDAGFSTLYRDLREDKPLDRLAPSDRIGNGIEATQLLAATFLGNLLAHCEASMEIGPNRQALQLIELARKLTLLSTYCDYLSVRAGAGDADAWYQRECQAAQSKKLGSVSPEGKKVSVTEALKLRPSDTLVHLEGFVSELSLMRGDSRGKYSSVFNLNDRISGKAIPIRAHMFNLAANGLENGCFCAVHGRIIAEGEWQGDSVGVELDRVSLTEQRKTSWIDHVTYCMRDYFILYLDEMNMSFTPHLTQEKVT